MRNTILIITFLVIFSVAVGVTARSWWQHNRLHWFCLGTVAMGFWQDSGPGMERYLDKLTKGETGDLSWDSTTRLNFLIRYSEYGPCVPLDEEKFWYWNHRMADEYDWAEAHLMLALKYGYGTFVDGKLGKAYPSHPWWAYATREERFRIADGYGNGENLDIARSLELLKKSAEKGDTYAQLFLSGVYYTGYWGKRVDGSPMVEVDYLESLKWLEKAAQLEPDAYARANFYAGEHYRYAEKYGLKPDYEKAHEYYIAATTANDPDFEAMLELALMYADGVGFPASSQQASLWLDKAQHRLDEIKDIWGGGAQNLEDEDNAARIKDAIARGYDKLNTVKQRIK